MLEFYDQSVKIEIKNTQIINNIADAIMHFKIQLILRPHMIMPPNSDILTEEDFALVPRHIILFFFQALFGYGIFRQFILKPF